MAYLIVLALLVFIAWRLIRRPPVRNNRDSIINDELDRATSRHKQQNLVVCLAIQGGSHNYSRGPINHEVDAPENAIFQIGSVTKVFTTALLQILHDKGELSKTTTLHHCLADRYTLHDRIRNVTLEQLATHRSGFPRVPKPLLRKIIIASGAQGVMHNPYTHLSIDDVFDYLAEPVGFKNDHRFRYSNYGVGLLGHVIEVVCGESLETLMQREIFAPLEMQSTSFDKTTLTTQQLIAGLNSKGEPTPDWEFGALAAAGGLYSSASDLNRFLQAYLQEQPLESLGNMLAPDTLGKTAFGWMLPLPWHRWFGLAHCRWHDGRVGGFAASVVIDPSRCVSLVVLRNQSLDTDWIATMMLWKLRYCLNRNPHSSPSQG